MNRGFSTIEIILAFGILTSTIIAAALVAYGMPALIQNAFAEEEAMTRIQAALEHTELLARNTVFTSIATTTENTIATSLRVESIDDSAYWLYSYASWLNARGVSESIFHESMLENTADSADHPCEPFVSGDWIHPRVIATYALTSTDLFPASVPGGQYAVSSLAIQSNVLAIGIGTTTHATDPTLFFFRITDPAQPPRYINSFDNASVSRTGYSALAAGGGAIYAGNGFGSASNSTCASDAGTCAQVHIYDVSGPMPVRASTLKLSTTSPVRAVVASGATASADALTYRDTYLYLGLQKTAGGQEVQIIDVNDIHTPKRIGGISIGRGVNAIISDGGSAYIATDDNSGGGKAIITENIQDATHPFETASYGFSGAGYARALARAGSRLFVGRSYASGTSEEFSLLDRTALARVGGVDIGTGAAHRGAYSIIMRDFLSFVLTEDQLQIWNVHDPKHPLPYSALVLPHGNGTAMTCRQNTLYVGSVDTAGTGYLTVITSS